MCTPCASNCSRIFREFLLPDALDRQSHHVGPALPARSVRRTPWTSFEVRRPWSGGRWGRSSLCSDLADLDRRRIAPSWAPCRRRSSGRRYPSFRGSRRGRSSTATARRAWLVELRRLEALLTGGSAPQEPAVLIFAAFFFIALSFASQRLLAPSPQLAEARPDVLMRSRMPLLLGRVRPPPPSMRLACLSARLRFQGGAWLVLLAGVLCTLSTMRLAFAQPGVFQVRGARSTVRCERWRCAVCLLAC